MYIRGKCSDLSFTFTGRPPINPFSVIEFIVRILNTQPGRNISALNELIRKTNEAACGVVENQVELLAALDAVFTAETTAFLEQILHTPSNDLRLARYLRFLDSIRKLIFICLSYFEYAQASITRCDVRVCHSRNRVRLPPVAFTVRSIISYQPCIFVRYSFV
jgi:hypothetical protein